MKAPSVRPFTRMALLGLTLSFGGHLACSLATASELSEYPEFARDVRPILAEYCFGCHGDGANEGGLALDQLAKVSDRAQANESWYRVLRKVEAGLMPPPDELKPSDEETATLLSWIKVSAFGLDRTDPDPGRVTVRRLNQVEYRNTIRDLLGVDYDTAGNFPADDTGHGFDNIGDVLSVSPLLLEKYVNAAEEIISSVVPMTSAVIREFRLPGDQLQLDPLPPQPADDEAQSQTEGRGRSRSRRRPSGPPPGVTELSYYTERAARGILKAPHKGEYVLRLSMRATEDYVDNEFDLNKCEFVLSLDDRELVRREFVRQNRIDYRLEFPVELDAGAHQVVAAVTPRSEERQVRNLRFQIESIDLVGPQAEQHYVKPAGYERFFPRDVPDTADGRRAYARELLTAFATRAYRWPVEARTVERLIDLAESVYEGGNGTFEAGIAKAMTAVIASPRFLFREERIASDSRQDRFPHIDQYSLASRLSYFLWSSIPDEELTELARAGKLRAELDAQVSRMLADDKARALSENFVGQWLRSRAIETVQINARAVMRRENPPDPGAEEARRRFFALYRKGDERTETEEKEFQEAREAFRSSFRRRGRYNLTDDLRTAMRRETEMLFEHILKEDRSILEMVDSDYTFLNEELARFYEIEGLDPIEGEALRLVALPPDSLRGGVLTQGTVLAVTSNPDRTSPVKRGLFILENLLGTPPSAPPPNIPALEDVESDPDRPLTLRETLAIHRQQALCASCHDRMDPLGLAFEHFNALGRYREEELGQPIDAVAVFPTGEEFSSVNDLKKYLVDRRADEIYRCVTEKMLTYALGRAVEYWDVVTIDAIVEELKESGGRASSLVGGIIHSAAFQRTRRASDSGLAAQ